MQVKIGLHQFDIYLSQVKINVKTVNNSHTQDICDFFILQQDSAKAHRVCETISFLACNLAKCWLVLIFLQHTQQWICSKFLLKMPQHLKCLDCLDTVINDLPSITIHVSNCHLFSDITISQGSVATRLRCGGIFSYHFTANLLPSLTVK